MTDFERAGITRLLLSSTGALAAPSWKRDVPLLEELLQCHRPAPDAPLLYEHITAMSGDALSSRRREIARVSPRLADFTDQLRRSMHAFGCGALIEDFGLSRLDLQSRAVVVYALAVCLGEPTATDARQQRVIWDVRPRHLEANYFATYSEHDGEAAFHTDTQYYPMPERYFLLYTAQAARCGGGSSTVCDARVLREALDADANRWVSRLLTQHPLPFRVPSAFVTVDRPDVVQATVAPVFADTPFIRYRRDTLLSGLRAFPEYGNSDVQRALDVFDDLLLHCPSKVDFVMPSDALLLIDNHHAVHARSAFRDPLRHLLRIRIRASEGTHEACGYELLTRVVSESLDRD